MATQTLLAVIEVNEEQLGHGHGYSELPEKLFRKINGVQALELISLYLLNPKLDPTETLNALALNYHHYSVSVRGEPCTRKGCEQHDVGGPTLNFNGHHIRRNNPPQGFN